MVTKLPPRVFRFKAFLDANVIANWMLLDQAVAEEKTKGEEALKELREKTARKLPSYLLLEELRTLGTRSPILFGTFAIAETSHVLLEEYLSRRLYSRGVPFQFWEALRKQEHLFDEDVKELENWINHFMITFSKSKGRILSWYEKPDFFEVIHDTISLRVSSTDSFLISQAVEAECEYYVTEDGTLRDTIREVRPITPMSAQAMLTELKRRE